MRASQSRGATMRFAAGRRCRRRSRRGVVIVVVTVVILLISLAAYGFLLLMQTENQAARARGDLLQAQAVAASGREYLAAILELPREQRPVITPGEDASELFGNVLVDGDAEETNEDAREGRFSLIVPDDSESATRGWRYGYENESAKLHLGRLLFLERREPGAARAALMNLPDMDESIADGILDWIDPDDDPRDQGAEAEYYRGLSPPLEPRNAIPPTLEELLLVKGMTREKLFGTDVNADFKVDALEQQWSRQAETGSQEAVPWCRFLTVHSGERDETYDGKPRVSLNQPDLSALHRELSAASSAEWANYIVAFRQYGPSSGSGSAAARDASELQIDFSAPAQRWIRSPLELIGTYVTLPVDPAAEKREPEVFASPFEDDPVAMRDYLPRLMDAVTVGDGQPLWGRVNVDLAPVEVLAALPGIDGALADRIISARNLGDASDTTGRHAVWLLLEDIVDRTTMMRLEPFVTTGGDVGRAQFIGYYDLRSPVVRFEAVVDGTERPARQVYYRDLGRLGRGVVEDVMDVTNAP